MGLQTNGERSPGMLAVNFIYVFNRLCPAIAATVATPPHQAHSHTHTQTNTRWQPILVRFLTAQIEFAFACPVPAVPAFHCLLAVRIVLRLHKVKFCLLDQR